MNEFLLPAKEVVSELLVNNSRFIATMGPLFSQDEAKEILNRIRKQYPDATHHVMAYIIGFGQSMISHANDDGEPSGTAGRPALSVLTGSGLGNIYAVVTRYFGGTKLGTGGLVKAYGDSVKCGLAVLPKARLVLTTTIQSVFSYSYLERVRLLAQQNASVILSENFTDLVSLTIQVPDIEMEKLRQGLVNLTSGQIEISILNSNQQTIMPVD